MKRYDISYRESGFGDILIEEIEHKEGEWVREEDIKPIIEGYQREIEELKEEVYALQAELDIQQELRKIN